MKKFVWILLLSFSLSLADSIFYNLIQKLETENQILRTLLASKNNKKFEKLIETNERLIGKLEIIGNFEYNSTSKNENSITNNNKDLLNKLLDTEKSIIMELKQLSTRIKNQKIANLLGNIAKKRENLLNKANKKIKRIVFDRNQIYSKRFATTEITATVKNIYTLDKEQLREKLGIMNGRGNRRRNNQMKWLVVDLEYNNKLITAILGPTWLIQKVDVKIGDTVKVEGFIPPYSQEKVITVCKFKTNSVEYDFSKLKRFCTPYYKFSRKGNFQNGRFRNGQQYRN